MGRVQFNTIDFIKTHHFHNYDSPPNEIKNCITVGHMNDRKPCTENLLIIDQDLRNSFHRDDFFNLKDSYIEFAPA